MVFWNGPIRHKSLVGLSEIEFGPPLWDFGV